MGGHVREWGRDLGTCVSTDGTSESYRLVMLVPKIQFVEPAKRCGNKSANPPDSKLPNGSIRTRLAIDGPRRPDDRHTPPYATILSMLRCPSDPGFDWPFAGPNQLPALHGRFVPPVSHGEIRT